MITLSLERDPNAPPEPREVKGFQKIWRRRMRIRAATLGFFPLAALAALVAPALLGYVMTAWIVTILATVVVHASSSCPRCKEPCFIQPPRKVPWSTRCLNCQTQLYWELPSIPSESHWRPADQPGKTPPVR